MSKGLGQIQREVRNFFRRRPYAAITAEMLCRSIHLSDPTRAQMVALVRSVKRLAANYPIGYMVATSRGKPLVIYRTGNELLISRAKSLCQKGNKEDAINKLPPKSEPQRGGADQQRTPGAIAAAYKYLLQIGQEPTPEIIMKFLEVGGRSIFTEAEVLIALSSLRSGGHLDRLRVEVEA
jgi:hypothetical protein